MRSRMRSRRSRKSRRRNRGESRRKSYKMKSKSKKSKDISMSSKLNSYKIIKEIGKGRFGSVYLVTDGENQYAMKRVKASSKKLIDAFQREVDMQVKAAELGVAPEVIDSFIMVSDGKKTGYIVMEAISGPTFKELSAHPKKNHEAAVDAYEKIERLHEHNILHSDLNKLDNIIYDKKRKEPYIIDFGLAQPFDEVLARDAAKHTRKLTDKDMKKKMIFWQDFDKAHLRARFGLN